MSCQLLHRIDPDMNMARFYRVEMLPDLFGAIIVERRWGRIGSRGQSLTASYPSIQVARAAATDLIRAKERRGYRECLLTANAASEGQRDESYQICHAWGQP